MGRPGRTSEIRDVVAMDGSRQAHRAQVRSYNGHPDDDTTCMSTTTPALTFRNATAADVDALVALVTSAYRGDASRVGWTTEADFLDGNRIDAEVLRHDIERPRSRVILAERDAALLACAHIADEDGCGYFGMFSVIPGLQGGGIGKTLLAECERIARDEWHLPAMRMTVIDIRDELIAFYERRGYHRTGTYKPFPHGDERFGVAKRDDLRFEVLEKPL
jgi:GNAT superfamily N-acetyltransferase